jgi:hypothetical protein
MIGMLFGIIAKLNTVMARLTEARAGYLDSLQYYTQSRAGYLDLLNSNLNAQVSSRLGSIKSIQRGTIFLPNGNATGTATITSVNVAASLLSHLGTTDGGSA